jgi:hypothetical protein
MFLLTTKIYLKKKFHLYDGVQTRKHHKKQKEDVTSVAKVRWPLAAGKRREHPDPAYYENLFEWIGVTLVLQAISNAGRTASLKTSVKCH